MKKILLIITLLFLSATLYSCDFIKGIFNKDDYFIVTFETNGGLPKPNNREVKKGELISKPEINPSLTGYVFDSWYKDNNTFIDEWEFEKDTVEEDITLYAYFYKEGEQRLPNDWDFSINDARIDGDSLTWDTVDHADKYLIHYEKTITEVTNNQFSLSALQSDLQDTKVIGISAKAEGYEDGRLCEFEVTYYPKNDDELFYIASADGDSLGSYPTEDKEVEIDEMTWIFNNALLGLLAGDKLNGLRAIRMRNEGYIYTNFFIERFSRLEFSLASYGSDPLNTINISVRNSSDGEWIFVKSFDTTSTLTVNQISFSDISSFVASGDNLQFRFSLPSGNGENKRINLDDITFYQTAPARYTVKPKAEYSYSEYYDGIDGLTGNQLLNKLHGIISTDFVGYKYSSAKTILAESDLIDNGTSKYLWGVYDSQELYYEWSTEKGKAWEREHVWPNSRLGVERVGESTINLASDLHNLRAVGGTKTGGVNQSRSNRYYLNGSGDWSKVGTQGFYPGDEHKGDVARIIFYMFVRYEHLKLTSDTSKLDTLSNSPYTYSVDGAYMGSLDLLISWHKEDPVSDFERNRNEIIYSYQNNRNPFIDYENLVDLLFDDSLTLSAKNNSHSFDLVKSLSVLIIEHEAVIEINKELFI